jgi:hypothetical protein
MDLCALIVMQPYAKVARGARMRKVVKPLGVTVPVATGRGNWLKGPVQLCHPFELWMLLSEAQAAFMRELLDRAAAAVTSLGGLRGSSLPTLKTAEQLRAASARPFRFACSASVVAQSRFRKLVYQHHVGVESFRGFPPHAPEG